jgi:hypothetical protein
VDSRAQQGAAEGSRQMRGQPAAEGRNRGQASNHFCSCRYTVQAHTESSACWGTCFFPADFVCCPSYVLHTQGHSLGAGTHAYLVHDVEGSRWLRFTPGTFTQVQANLQYARQQYI